MLGPLLSLLYVCQQGQVGPSCAACPSNSFCALPSGCASCTPCPNGSIASADASTCLPLGCQACPDGFCCAGGTSKVRCACPAGSSLVEGACVACPAGTYSLHQSCVACAAGKYSWSNATACVSCHTSSS